MKISSTLAIAVLALVATVAYDAGAARVSGGKSLGAQRPSVTPRAATPPAATAPSAAASQPVMPAQPGATLPAKPAMPATAAPAASGMSRWLGPIAGIAAGLGLAALLSHFGLPEGLGTFLLLALLVVGVVFALRLLFARRKPEPLAYAGAPRADTPKPFEKVATPQWGGGQRIEPVLGSASVTPSMVNPFPPGFDAAGFARHAKQQFIALQAAHDAADHAALRDVLTPEMYAEVVRDLDAGTRSGDGSREPRCRGARCRDRRRSPLGERALHRQAARRRRRAGSLRRNLEPVEACRRQVGLDARRDSAIRLIARVTSLRLDPAVVPAALANRVLAREQWARSCLASHAGRVFRIVVAPVATSLSIDASGSIEPAAASDGAPDLTLTLSPLRVPAFLAAPTRWDELLVVDGDPALAATLKGLAETLPWFVERAFAEALGPIAGQFLADAGRRMLEFPGYAGERVGDSVTSYVRDEVRLAATRADAKSIGDEIADTATRVDALAARVDALAARFAAALPKS